MAEIIGNQTFKLLPEIESETLENPVCIPVITDSIIYFEK